MSEGLSQKKCFSINKLQYYNYVKLFPCQDSLQIKQKIYTIFFLNIKQALQNMHKWSQVFKLEGLLKGDVIT